MTIHEVSHGYVAYRLGDPTAKAAGRLTLNPLAHLDPIGTLMLVIFRFGWAKPVPINPLYFRDRRRGVLLTSLAGPASNFLGAVLAAYLMLQFSLGLPTLTAILYYFLMYNLWLGLFNLIPVPPLDGSNILRSLAPYGSGLWNAMNLMDQYGWLILILLLMLRIIPRLLLPVANALQTFIISLVSLAVI
ncbi:MAG: site-2 protease family protein [Bacillota bacterium]